MKVQDASAALEYLMLGPDERINYRVEKGITLKEWYNGFTAPRLPNQVIPSMDVARMFGQTRNSWTRFVKSGLFGEPRKEGKRNYFEAQKVQKVLDTCAKLVPNGAFEEVYEDKKWYLSLHIYGHLFRHLFQKFPVRRGSGVSIGDAAKITKEIRERKDKIDNWRSLDELQDELGWNLSYRGLITRVTKMHERGELQWDKAPKYENGEMVRANRYVIHPAEFDRVVKREREIAELAKTAVTSTELGKRLGLHRTYAATIMANGECLGLFERIPLHHDQSSGGHWYGVTPEIADAIVDGELSLYRSSLAEKSSKELALIAERVKAAHTSTTLPQLAERLDKSKNWTHLFVQRGIDAGLIHPIGYIPHLPILIPNDEAERIVSGELQVPTHDQMKRAALRKTSIPLQELADQMEVPYRFLQPRIRKAIRAGLIHPVGYKSEDDRHKHKHIPLDEAQKLMSGEIKLPTELEVRFPNINEAVRIADVAERLGLSYSSALRRVSNVRKAGRLTTLQYHLKGKKPHYRYIPAEEAERLIAGKINIPTDGELKLLLSKPDPNTTLEARVRRNVLQGDAHSYDVLVQLYDPAIQELAEEYRFGSSADERVLFLQTALFEIIAEVPATTPRSTIISLLEQKLQDRHREEKPSWLSLDKVLSSDTTTTLLDMIPDTGGFFG